MRKFPLLVGALVPIALVATVALVVCSGHFKRQAHRMPAQPLHPVTKQRLQADELYGKRDLKAARKAYETIIHANESSKDKKAQDEVGAARMHLGYVVAKTEGYAKAREVFLAAAKSYKGSGAMDPEYGRPDDQAAYQAAVCLVAEGKKGQARKEFEQLIKERPKSPVIYQAFRRMQRRGLNRAEGGSLTPAQASLCFRRARRAASRARRRLRSARIGAMSSNVDAPLATIPRRLKAYLLGFAPVYRYISSTPITAT